MDSVPLEVELIPKPKSKIPLLVVGGIIIFGLGIALGLFFGRNLYSTPQPISTPSPTVRATPLSDSTANWKTYTNEKLGISFKYPSVYIVDEKAPGYFVINSQTDTAPQDGISIDARIIGPYENYSGSEKYLRTSFIIDKEYGVENWLIFNTTGKDGMLIGVKFKTAIARYKTGAIVVEALNNPSSEYVMVFDQILSTFKFLSTESDLQRRTGINAEIRPALELYKFDNKQYPVSLELLVPKYLTTLPVDPITKKPYSYTVSPDKSSYIITVKMDNGTDLIAESP